MASPKQPPLPKNYRLIYDIVEASGAGRHLTSSEIYAKARKRRPGIGFSTVYRGLERLRNLGLVSELHVPGVDVGDLRTGRATARSLSLQRVRRDRRRRVRDPGAYDQSASLTAWFRDRKRTRNVRRPLRGLRRVLSYAAIARNRDWACPKCGRIFRRINQRHACGVGSGETLLKDRPELAGRALP